MISLDRSAVVPAHDAFARLPLAELAIVMLGVGVQWMGDHRLAALPWWAPWDFSWPGFLCAGWSLLWFCRGLGRSAEDWGPWRVTSFLTGFAAIYLVWLTQFEYSAQHMFFLNRIQHAAMHHLGPFLIALSWPGATIARGMPPKLRDLAQGRAASRLLRAVQRPLIAVFLFEGLLILWLIPPVTFRAMLDPRLYEIMNISMVVDGLLFWFFVLDPRPAPAAPAGYFARAVMAFMIIFPQIVTGVIIGGARTDLYPSFSLCGRIFASIGSLQDQQIGSLILWAPAGMMSAIATIICIARLCRDQDARSSVSPIARVQETIP